MNRKPRTRSAPLLLLAGLLAGMTFLYSQKSIPVTAQGMEALHGTVTAAAVPEETMTPASQTGLPRIEMRIGEKSYWLEMASTPEQEEKGLMFRTALAPRHGMIFAFQPPRPVSFWMKNTKVPLDMIFLRDGQVVHIQKSAQPCLSDPCPQYPSEAEVDSVVELPAGTAAQDSIRKGDAAVAVSKPWLPQTSTEPEGK